MLAGSQSLMARIGLSELSDILINPNIEVQLLDGTDHEAIEATLQISATAFKWPPEQVQAERAGWFEKIKSERLRRKERVYLARLNGKPVAEAHLVLRAGTAYLGGAATLPAYRSQKIYSTLLRRRLEDARAAGYHVSCINAEPMSRRVVWISMTWKWW
mgnify:CR=1 FL=1